MARSIELEQVSVTTLQGKPVVAGVDLRIAPGERVSLVGASGAGKTTLLRLINGLVVPSSGDVRIDGASVRQLDGPKLRRGLGYIIQGAGLFPHRSVFENVAVVPRLLGWEESRVQVAIESILNEVNLPFADYASRFPRTLSGGEQQRVGVARALVAEPDVLLCDEPFSALDPIARREHQKLFLNLASKGKPTVVFVTHDLREALAVSGRIVLLDRGQVVIDLASHEFLTHPDPLVQRFVESATLAVAS